VTVAPHVLEMPDPDAKHRAFLPLLGSITSQLVAIRRLVVAGLDFPAKQICRGLLEHVDVGVRMTLDETALDTFLANPEVHGAQRFWQFIRRRQTKGGGRSHLRDSLFEASRRLGLTEHANKEWQDFREGEEAILNACIHPSLVAYQMATIGDDFDPNDNKIMSWLPNFGLASSFSARTLQYAILSGFDYVMFGWTPDYGAGNEKLLGNELTQIAYNHVYQGRGILQILAVIVVRKVSAGEL
jgi:hypothetical protein